MGHGWGGRRRGAGHPAVPRPQGKPRDEPAARAARRLYDQLAPLARQQGTLVPATELEFGVLVDLLVMQQRVQRALVRAKRIDTGFELLMRTHASLTRRVEAKLRAFCLAPRGQRLIAP